MIPHHIHKLLARDTPKWHSLAANECGRMFGERNSASLGANLFRQEREAAMQQKMRTVDAVLRAYGGERSDALTASLEASRSMLPVLNPRSSKLKLGAGYIKVDLMAEERPGSIRSAVSPPMLSYPCPCSAAGACWVALCSGVASLPPCVAACAHAHTHARTRLGQRRVDELGRCRGAQAGSDARCWGHLAACEPQGAARQRW